MKLQGIFTPNIVPLDKDGLINECELRRYTDWLIDRGVHGLYPNGSTGEFTRFSPDERREIVRIMVEQAGGRVPILAGAAEANIKETLDTCEYYGSLGVTAVAIVSPFYYKLSPEGVYQYFKEIGDQTTIDVTLYNIPMFASPIDVPTIQRLSEECPKIVGIKDSSGDITHMIRMINAVRPNRPDFSFLTGWEAALMPMLVVGCDGGTHATSGVVPELTRKLFDLTQSGQIDAARQLQARLITLFDLMVFTGDFPNGFRQGVKLRGFETGESRQPVGESQQLELDSLRQMLGCLLAEEGFVNEPIEGCPVSGADLNIDNVSQIVQQVVRELKNRGW